MSIKAKESPQIQKARNKLKKRIESEKNRITLTALHEMSHHITKWLSRHANERIALKNKSFVVFDENRHPAKTQSKYVYRLLHHLKTEFGKQESLKNFKGRITQE